MPPSVYDAMLGDVDIISRSPYLGNPAEMVENAPQDATTKYADRVFSNSDRINMGVGGRFSVPAATTSNIPPPNVSDPFKTLKVTIPSSVAEFLLVVQVTIGPVMLIDGDQIAADLWSEVSLNNGVDWPTAQTGQSFRFQIENADAVAPHEPRLTLTGFRLRQ